MCKDRGDRARAFRATEAAERAYEFTGERNVATRERAAERFGERRHREHATRRSERVGCEAGDSRARARDSLGERFERRDVTDAKKRMRRFARHLVVAVEHRLAQTRDEARVLGFSGESQRQSLAALRSAGDRLDESVRHFLADRQQHARETLAALRVHLDLELVEHARHAAGAEFAQHTGGVQTGVYIRVAGAPDQIVERRAARDLGQAFQRRLALREGTLGIVARVRCEHQQRAVALVDDTLCDELLRREHDLADHVAVAEIVVALGEFAQSFHQPQCAGDLGSGVERRLIDVNRAQLLEQVDRGCDFAACDRLIVAVEFVFSEFDDRSRVEDRHRFADWGFFDDRHFALRGARDGEVRARE